MEAKIQEILAKDTKDITMGELDRILYAGGVYGYPAPEYWLDDLLPAPRVSGTGALLWRVYRAARRAMHGWASGMFAPVTVRSYLWERSGDIDEFISLGVVLEDLRGRFERVLWRGVDPADYEWDYDAPACRWISAGKRLRVEVTPKSTKAVVRRPAGDVFIVTGTDDGVTAEYSGMPLHNGVLVGLEQAVQTATGRPLKLSYRVGDLVAPYGGDQPERSLTEPEWAAIRRLIVGGE